MVSLDSVKIIDGHAHPFLMEKEGEDFSLYWSTSLLPGAGPNNKNTLTYRMMIETLKPVLGLEPSTGDEKVIARRNELYQSDMKAYLSLLFDEAGLETVLADMGYPTEVFSGYSVDFEQFSAFMPTTTKAVVRIEPLVFALIGQGLGPAEFFKAFDRMLEEEISRLRPVALKTVIAYLTGLKVTRFGPQEVEKSFLAFSADQNDFEAAKPFLNSLVFQTVAKCREKDLPLQMHTGFGNAPLLDVSRSNPSLLYGFLNDPEVSGVKLVLLHAGYPYVREMAYLVNNYPNAWVDISQVTQFTGVGLEAVLTDLLAMVPVDKIMYGSDGLGVPELYWWPAIQIRKCLPLTLDRFLEQGLITEPLAEEIGRGILRENSLKLYGLE